MTAATLRLVAAQSPSSTSCLQQETGGTLPVRRAGTRTFYVDTDVALVVLVIGLCSAQTSHPRSGQSGASPRPTRNVCVENSIKRSSSTCQNAAGIHRSPSDFSAALKVDADDDDDDDDDEEDEEDEDEGHRCFLELSLTSAQPSGRVGLPDRSRP